MRAHMTGKQSSIPEGKKNLFFLRSGENYTNVGFGAGVGFNKLKPPFC